jgi:predicted transcriptional regulator
MPVLNPYDEDLAPASTRVRASTRATLDQLAAQRGTRLSRLVADAVEEYLARHVDGFEPQFIAAAAEGAPLQLTVPTDEETRVAS